MSPRAATAPVVDADDLPPARTPLEQIEELSPGFHELQVRLLRPSPLNPRRQVTDIADLAASIRAQGVLEPLLVRPTATGAEIVAGERRWRAAQAAGLHTVPVMVRPLNDAQVLEAAIVENSQRADVHPLDEAAALDRLQQLDATYTLERLAATIGRPIAYVRHRLRLLALIGDARAAFHAGTLTLGHAQLLAPLTPEMQGRALKAACFDTEFNYDTGTGDRIVGPGPLTRLREFIRAHVRLDPTSADAQEEFPELAADVSAATAKGATVLMLRDEWGPPSKPGEPLNRDEFQEAKKGAKGAQLGVFVQGRRRGKTIWVTPVVKQAPPAPPKAGKPPAAPTPSPKAKAALAAAKAEADLRQARSREVERRAVVQLAKTAKLTHLTNAPALRMLASALAGRPCFDAPELQLAAAQAGVPHDVFAFSGEKTRHKLPAQKLAVIVAIQAVGAEIDNYIDDRDGDRRAAFAAFGVDLKAIDKAVAKEQAAAAKASAKAASVVHKLHPKAATKKAAKKR